MGILATNEEIKKAIPLLDLKWEVQNDEHDKESRFIYYCQKIDQVISLANSNNIDMGYAIHRWYNFQCSKKVEEIVCHYGGKANPKEKDHDVDLTLFGIPFDIKVSVVSPQYTGDTNLNTRENKNEYIWWLKEKASKEGRRHDGNRLFVICKDQALKCDFEKITEKIKKFVDYFAMNKDKYKTAGSCELIYIE